MEHFTVCRLGRSLAQTLNRASPAPPYDLSNRPDRVEYAADVHPRNHITATFVLSVYYSITTTTPDSQLLQSLRCIGETREWTPATKHG